MANSVDPDEAAHSGTTLFAKGYRKAFAGQVGKGHCHYGSFEMTTQTAPSPASPSNQSPLSIVQPRHQNRATYVQRWKVLRDRNKNLPMLDFNAKASGIPKKYQAPSFPGGSFSRSYTYDAMRLPSISTASVVTGISNASLKSDGYRRRGRRDKKSTLQEQQSESLQDLSTLDKEYLGLNDQLSKSLTNLADKKDSQESVSKHRYERFSYSKQISSRRNAKSRSRDLKDIAGGGTFARENTMASSFISQDKDKKQCVEKRDQPHKDTHTEKFRELKKIYGSRKDRNKNDPDKEKEKETQVKSELQVLEQSGIYQIDLSSIRNEIPPVSENVSLPPLSAKTERSYHTRLPSRERSSKKRSDGSRYGQRTVAVSKKWRDDCDCLRCSIIKRQFMEGDASYMMWGNYPCRKIIKSRNSSEMCYYDSD